MTAAWRWRNPRSSSRWLRASSGAGLVRTRRGALLLCLLVVGFWVQAEDAADPASAGGGAVSSDGSYYVEWWPDPLPLPLNEMFEIHFKVSHAEQRERLVAGAVVTASVWMPEHRHGTSLQPVVRSAGDGTAIGSGFLLHMEGHWQLRVGVAVAGRMERASFDFVLNP